MLSTIISIDCDSDLLAARAEILQTAGYAVLSASDPEDALDLLTSQQAFDLVILAQEFVNEMTECRAMLLHRTPAIPVVVMQTGPADRDIRADGYVNVADGPEALLTAVMSILAQELRQDVDLRHVYSSSICRSAAGTLPI